jgi:excisionase family DNA binding protein
MTMADPLLTAKEVAGMLRLSLPTLYRRVGDGTLPKPMKFGSLSRWSQSEILAAVSAAGDRRTAMVRARSAAGSRVVEASV